MASPPSCGGRPCDGEQQKSLPCNSFSCPAPLCVWAGWEDWSEWSEAVVVEARMVKSRLRVRQQEGGEECVRVANQTDFTDVAVRVTSDPPEPETKKPEPETILPVYLSAGFLGCLGKFYL